MSLPRIIAMMSSELVSKSDLIRDYEMRMQRMYQLASDLVWPDASTSLIMDEFRDLMPDHLPGKKLLSFLSFNCH